jgi:hypothetical protein
VPGAEYGLRFVWSANDYRTSPQPLPSVKKGQWSTLIWLNGLFLLLPNHLVMTRPDEPDQGKPRPQPSRLEEAKQIIQEYTNDLREIIKKLRQRLH